MDDSVPPPAVDDGPGLFGDLPSASPQGYLVLARKYRPRTFADLIGQEVMVKTIANSFALGRIPHAYMLTGVRGVGKTTTARLLARALNYDSPHHKGPSVDLEPLGQHCQPIMESRHPDVFEMDAASRTGINDIREILDSVRYAPVMARTKVYIIDEVHMLSTQAFNGLLKTLEEPPPHVKFIFATTEIRKVPVTVLSRCQRFDLKRIAPPVLASHLERICATEGVQVAADGLALIARAAEGSVRDGLSLLDQALVQHADGPRAVSAADVRDMLGLADRSRVLDLYAAILGGDVKTALTEVRAQHEAGADPGLMLRDLLEAGHDVARAQALGAEAQLVGAQDWIARLRALAGQHTPGRLSMVWSMLLKAFEEAQRAPDPLAAAEMTMIRLCAAASLPPPEDAARLLREGPTTTPQASGTGETSAPGGVQLRRFEDLLAFAARERRVDLELDLERHVRLISFTPGRMVFQPGPEMPQEFPNRLMRLFKELTGDTWTVETRTEAPAQVESLAERRRREEERERAALLAHPFVAEALKAFPGASLVKTTKPEPTGQTPAAGAVVPLARPDATPQASSTRPPKARKDSDR